MDAAVSASRVKPRAHGTTKAAVARLYGGVVDHCGALSVPPERLLARFCLIRLGLSAETRTAVSGHPLGGPRARAESRAAHRSGAQAGRSGDLEPTSPVPAAPSRRMSRLL